MFLFFKNPESCQAYTTADWERLFRKARAGRLLERVEAILRQRSLLVAVPAEAQWQLTSARVRSERAQRQMRWEIERIRTALRVPLNVHETPFPVVLLKGAAYLKSGLPWSEGRISVDVDILVPAENLLTVEAKFNQAGWFTAQNSEYDEHFYREWMHEIPPLHNYDRGTDLDVHHTLLPQTGKLTVDARKLLKRIVPLDGDADFYTLAPCDMLIHAAIHAFQDGDLNGTLRDLLDLDAMLRFFPEQDSEFLKKLAERTEELGLERPMFHALHYTSRLLGTPFPETLWKRCRNWGGGPCSRRVMDALVPRGVNVELPGRERQTVAWARTFLLIRQHWLRMPVRMLVPHLWKKWRVRREERRKRQAGDNH